MSCSFRIVARHRRLAGSIAIFPLTSLICAIQFEIFRALIKSMRFWFTFCSLVVASATNKIRSYLYFESGDPQRYDKMITLTCAILIVVIVGSLDALDSSRISKVVWSLMAAGLWFVNLVLWYFSYDERNAEYDFLGKTISARSIVIGGSWNGIVFCLSYGFNSWRFPEHLTAIPSWYPMVWDGEADENENKIDVEELERKRKKLQATLSSIEEVLSKVVGLALYEKKDDFQAKKAIFQEMETILNPPIANMVGATPISASRIIKPMKKRGKKSVRCLKRTVTRQLEKLDAERKIYVHRHNDISYNFLTKILKMEHEKAKRWSDKNHSFMLSIKSQWILLITLVLYIASTFIENEYFSLVVSIWAVLYLSPLVGVIHVGIFDAIVRCFVFWFEFLSLATAHLITAIRHYDVFGETVWGAQKIVGAIAQLLVTFIICSFDAVKAPKHIKMGCIAMSICLWLWYMAFWYFKDENDPMEIKWTFLGEKISVRSIVLNGTWSGIVFFMGSFVKATRVPNYLTTVPTRIPVIWTRPRRNAVESRSDPSKDTTFQDINSVNL